MKLSDLRPQTISVCGVDVYGISVQDMADLFNRYPDLNKLISGTDISVQSVLKTGPQAVAAIIAAGCRELGNTEAEKSALALVLDQQVEFIEAIVKLTFPGGVGPFVERLNAIAGTVSGNYGKEPDTK